MVKPDDQQPPAPQTDVSPEWAQLRTHHAGQRVLLAEDNPVSQVAASELLASAGLAVEVARDGAQAVALALSRHYDLVLMDMQMPGMDGLDASRALRERASAALPIIALTSNASAAERAACLAAGMNDHLTKPVRADTLFATLLRWLPARATAPHMATPAPARPARECALPPGQGLLARLSWLEHFDHAEVLLNLGGRLESLERVLRSFVDTYRSAGSMFETLARDPARERCREACHVLRGEYVLLGSAELTRRLQALEHSLQCAGNPPETRLLARQLDEALASLASRLGTALAA